MSLFAIAFGFAQANANEYEIKILNRSQGQPLTTPLAITHGDDVRLFEVGQPAPREIWELAEDGRTNLLERKLKTSGKNLTTQLGDSAVLPGKTLSLTVVTRAGETRLSLISMLGTTNDGFTGLQGVLLPASGSITLTPPVFSAGSEENNELCAFIPGPPCNNHDARKPEGAVGYVNFHRGIRGVGDLDPAKYGWVNSVAEITLTRTK